MPFYNTSDINVKSSFLQELNIIHLAEQTDVEMLRSISEILLEGFIMLVVATCGVFLNISSVIYFAQLRKQRPFHRFVFLHQFLGPAPQCSTLIGRECRDTLLSLIESYCAGAKVYAITAHLTECLSVCCYGMISGFHARKSSIIGARMS